MSCDFMFLFYLEILFYLWLSSFFLNKTNMNFTERETSKAMSDYEEKPDF